jgi:hypothetical protein
MKVELKTSYRNYNTGFVLLSLNLISSDNNKSSMIFGKEH